MFADYADDLQVVRPAALGRLRVTNMLTDRILIRKKFCRHFFVDYSNAPSILVLAFGLSEIAAAPQLDAERFEIAGRDCGIEGIDAGVRRFRIARHCFFGGKNPT